MDILIIDDDKIIRDGLKKIIYERFGDKITLHEKANGLQALEYIFVQNIDMIITDIKMPLFSGIELIERLKQLNYNGDIVVLSGFGDYNLVRSAMRMGAMDYLLKPVVPNELIELVNRSILKVNENEYTKNVLKENIELSSSELINNQQLIINAILVEYNEELIVNRYLSTNGIAPNMQVFLYLINCNSKYNKTHDLVTLFYDIKNIFHKLFNDNFILLQGKIELNQVVIIVNKQSAFLSNHMEFENGLTELGLDFIANSYKGCVKNIKNIYQEILEKSFDLFYLCKPIINNGTMDIDNLVLDIIKSAAELNVIGLENAIACFCKFVTNTRENVWTIKNQLVKMINKIVLENSKFIAVIGKYKFTEYDLSKCIYSANDIESLRTVLLETLTLYIQEIRLVKEKSHVDLIKKVLTIVEQGYQQDITLAEISARLFFHPNYLSKIFLDVTGKNFRDYLREYRIEKAKSLINKGELKIFEIASMVGYNDVAHFNRAFKKVTGLSPSEFKHL